MIAFVDGQGWVVTLSNLRKRLLLFAPSLHGGGAERTLARLANHWTEQGRFVTVMTVAAAHPNDFPLLPGIERIGLGLAGNGGLLGKLPSNFSRIWAVREVIRDLHPEMVVSFIEQTNVLALLAARPLDVPVVVSERSDPAKHVISPPWPWLRRYTYPHAAAVVVLTEETAELISSFVPTDRITVIPNSAPARSEKPDQDANVPREPIVLGVGRLAHEKGFDQLLEAVALLESRGMFSGWRLVLAGEGDARAALEEQAAALPSGMVEFTGQISDPNEWYRRASLFALPSRYEGFPNALLEAMAAGLPAVAFEDTATRQIIRHDWDGLLVPAGDVAGLADAISALMQDPIHRETLGRAARDVSRRFAEREIWSRWDAVVDQPSLRELSNSCSAEGWPNE